MGSLPINPTVHSIAVDPSDPKRVYVAGPAGLFLSDDAGLTWTAVPLAAEAEPTGLALDPTAPQRLFVLMADGSLWRSEDAGASWMALWTGKEGGK